MPPKRAPKAPPAPARSSAKKAQRPASTKKKQAPPKPAAKKKECQPAQAKNQEPKPVLKKAAQHKRASAKMSDTDDGEPLSKKIRNEKIKPQQQNLSETISDEDKVMTLKRLKETDRESYNAKVTNFVDAMMQKEAEVSPNQPVFNIYWDYLTSFRKNRLMPLRCGYMDPADIITAIAQHPFCGLERRVDLDAFGRMSRRDTNIGATPLLIAARVGVADVVTALLAAGANANARDEFDATSLHFAVVNEDVLCIDALLSVKDIDVDAKDRAGRSPLFYAIEDNQLYVVSSLLAKGADPFITNRGGNAFCLQAAAQSGNLAIVESIANVIERGGLNTFLYEAIESGHEGVVSFLLQIGGDVGGYEDYVPLLHASQIGEVECARLLLNNGADLEDESLLFSTIEHEAMVAELLAQGVSIQGTDEDGWTPLHNAVGYGNIHTISLLLARSDTQSLNQQTWFPSGQHCAGLETPLHIAVFYSHLDAVEALLNKGVQTEIADSLGRTPLQSALNRHSYPIIKALIVAGANIFVTFPNGMTTLHQAVIKSMESVGNVVRELVSLGVDPEVRCKKLNATPLLYAVGSNCIEAVSTLIDDCNANLEARDYLNRTPLLLAVGRIQYPFHFSFPRDISVPNEHVYISNQVIEKLLDAGACMEVYDEGLNTPLHIAAAKQDWRVIALLVAKGANVAVENKEGKTPLQLWIESFCFDLCYDADEFKRVVDMLEK